MRAIERRIAYLQVKLNEIDSKPDADKWRARSDWTKSELAALIWAHSVLLQVRSDDG